MTDITGNAAEWDAIQPAIQNYFDGLYHSDLDKLKAAFHPQAQVIGHFQGSFGAMTLDQFLGVVGQTPAPSQSGEEYDMKTVSVDVDGEVASVKVVDLYLGLRFIDVLTLMKVEDSWVIINKAYRHD